MIHYAVLGSGSNGNSYAITDGKATMLFDQGYSFVELKRRLASVSIPLETVIGCCVTHLHPDHVHGLGTFARKTGLPVYLNMDAILKEPVVYARLNFPSGVIRQVVTGVPFQAGPFSLSCFPTSHDSGGSVGWSVALEGKHFMLLTDTGFTTAEEKTIARTSDILFLEANYDEHMLETGPYPKVLKDRIRGRWGHLSNDDALRFLSESGFQGSRVYFIHLSSTNNNPALLASQAGGLYHGPFTVCEKGRTYEGSL